MDEDRYLYVCPECGYYCLGDSILGDYCPACGADMNVEEIGVESTDESDLDGDWGCITCLDRYEEEDGDMEVWEVDNYG